MDNLKHKIISSSVKVSDPEIESVNRNINKDIVKKNTKANARILSDFYDRIDALGGAIPRAKGAKYRLSHPLGF